MFDDLQSFLDIYYAACAVLVHEQDFFDLTDGVPGTRRSAGRPPRRDLLRPADPYRARRRARDRRRRDPPGAGREARRARHHVAADPVLPAPPERRRRDGDAGGSARRTGTRITGVGLDSAEVGAPAGEVPGRLRAGRQCRGFRAGRPRRRGGPARVHLARRSTCSASERIDHGVRCLEDERSWTAWRPSGFR